MLAKYNLTMKDLSLEIESKVLEKSIGARIRWWHGQLGIIIADNFRCKCYTLIDNCVGGKAFVFVGLEMDIDICVEIFEYCKKAINYNCKIHIEKRRLRKKENIKLAKESFIKGFIKGIRHALNNQKEENEWGLVLSVPAEVEDYYKEVTFTGKTSYDKDLKKIDEKSFIEGFIKGKNLDINISKHLIS